MDGLRLWATLAAAAIGSSAAEAALAPDRSGPGATRGWLVSAQAQPSEPTGYFRGTGNVTAIDPANGALTLDHDEIKGLMPAMIMMYRVRSPALSAGLRTGDRIEFGLDAKSYTILDVKVIGREK
ncbi:MAG: copper-binding protein [Roseiarcus sp.]|jgi:Cu/Ag efflux protein CusF